MTEDELRSYINDALVIFMQTIEEAVESGIPDGQDWATSQGQVDSYVEHIMDGVRQL